MSVRILTGDSRKVLAALPDASVQCVCTSPPYYGLRSYGIGTENGEIGLEQSPDAYVAEMVGVFREVRRVLADTGVVFLNLGDSYSGSPNSGGANGARSNGAGNGAARLAVRVAGLKSKRGEGIKPKDLLGIPWAVAFALRADGWWLRSAITWCKTAPMPESVVDRPTSATEMVFLLTKASRYFYDAVAVAEPAVEADHVARYAGRYQGDNPDRIDAGRSQLGGGATTRNLRNWWVINPQPYSGAHFATMPPDLAERCVRAGTSERGQCPHCGAPWARVVERDGEITQTARRAGLAEGVRERTSGASARKHSTLGAGSGGDVPRPAIVTTGWSPTCACPEHKPVPQTVLDPFFGAGTTGLVADRLGRHCIGVELNPTYADLARDRLRGDCPMFARIA